jgi:hypothetical protein
LNGGFRPEISQERAKKSIKEFHLAQETKIVILVAWREELGILK